MKILIKLKKLDPLIQIITLMTGILGIFFTIFTIIITIESNSLAKQSLNIQKNESLSIQLTMDDNNCFYNPRETQVMHRKTGSNLCGYEGCYPIKCSIDITNITPVDIKLEAISLYKITAINGVFMEMDEIFMEVDEVLKDDMKFVDFPIVVKGNTTISIPTFIAVPVNESINTVITNKFGEDKIPMSDVHTYFDIVSDAKTKLWQNNAIKINTDGKITTPKPTLDDVFYLEIATIRQNHFSVRFSPPSMTHSAGLFMERENSSKSSENISEREKVHKAKKHIANRFGKNVIFINRAFTSLLVDFIAVTIILLFPVWAITSGFMRKKYKYRSKGIPWYYGWNIYVNLTIALIISSTIFILVFLPRLLVVSPYIFVILPNGDFAIVEQF